jgi:glucose/mannose-6-phosphate isomerase
MSNLDNIERIKALDPGMMYQAIVGFPDQIRKAIDIGRAVKADAADFQNIKNIVVCGMGGSAIGGDLVRSLLADSLKCPLSICRNYHLPAFAGTDTLVVASSYSGSTEETLSAVSQALERGCRIIALTTGGPLGELCRKNDLPMAVLPPGMQPRAALGYSFIPLMMIFQTIGLSPYNPEHFRSLADFLEKRGAAYSIESPSDDNRSKQVAMQLYGRIPIIYSGPDVTDAVAVRFKGQICENAKMLAFANHFPEFNHNELVGWKVINPFRDYLRVIVFRDSGDHPRVSARMEIVGEMIKKEKIGVIEIHSEGENRLERMMSLVQFGDLTSFYLAILNKVDPTPVAAIEYLKDELAKLE